MRQLPMVGSLLNWWSPLPPEHAHIKGRSFDLKTGRIIATDARHVRVVQHDAAKLYLLQSALPNGGAAAPAQQPHQAPATDEVTS